MKANLALVAKPTGSIALSAHPVKTRAVSSKIFTLQVPATDFITLAKKAVKCTAEISVGVASITLTSNSVGIASALTACLVAYSVIRHIDIAATSCGISRKEEQLPLKETRLLHK